MINGHYEERGTRHVRGGGYEAEKHVQNGQHQAQAKSTDAGVGVRLALGGVLDRHVWNAALDGPAQGKRGSRETEGVRERV